MFIAKVKVSQRVHKYLAIEAESYDDIAQIARSECGMCITSPDDFDDFDDVEILSIQEDEKKLC